MVYNHFYHIRWPPLNVTIFIMHVRTCIMGVTPMLLENNMCWKLCKPCETLLNVLIICLSIKAITPQRFFLIVKIH